MDTISAYFRAQAASDKPQKVFDWDKAAHIIRESGTTYASAGLSEDWEWTGGPIYNEEGIIPRENTRVYLSSNWAIPELEIEGDLIECWIYENDSPGWDENTYWPESARKILEEKNPEV